MNWCPKQAKVMFNLCPKQAKNATSALTKVKPTASGQAASPVVLEPPGKSTEMSTGVLVVQKGRNVRMARLKTAPLAPQTTDGTTRTVSHAWKGFTILQRPALAKHVHLVSTKICVECSAARSAQSQAQPHLMEQSPASTVLPTATAPTLQSCFTATRATFQKVRSLSAKNVLPVTLAATIPTPLRNAL
jgi:hypothetical protein